jgi:hypothetical protein
MLRPRLTFANVIACTALFVALGGTGYAAISLPKGSVGARQLKQGSIGSSKIKDRSLRAVDLAPGLLAAGASSLAGAPGPTGPTGPTGPAGANGTNGTNGAAGPFPDVFPTGKTMRGVWGMFSPSISSVESSISFVWPLAGAPDVIRVPVGGPAPAGCSGTAASPAASPGRLCVFVGHILGDTNFAQLGYENPLTGTPGSAATVGVVLWSNGLGGGYWEMTGTWAVTAP